jgi:hypothetical protein
MKRPLLNLKNCLLFFVLSLGSQVQAQSPTDELMMPAKKACAFVGYEFGSFDQYWEGSTLRENQTIATVQRNTVNALVAVGIFDRLNVYVGLPYISTNSTEPNGGHLAGTSGIQDLTLAAKYQIVKTNLFKGEFSAFATLGFSTPVSNYSSDYQPYSLGLHTPELNYRGIVSYKSSKDLYVRAAGAYIWRGYTLTNREYYYNNGSYYTPWMDVPSAWSVDGAIGMFFFDEALRAEINYTMLRSTSGDDIRPYNAPQPTNMVNFDKVGTMVQYHFPKIKGLALMGAHSRIINGRNIGKSNAFTFGVMYQFQYLKSK